VKAVVPSALASWPRSSSNRLIKSHRAGIMVGLILFLGQ